MSTMDLWRRIFYLRYLDSSGAVLDPVAVAETYAQFFRGHHGSCDVRWTGGRACWSFAGCPHRGSADVCEAHQGFMLGLLDAAISRKVALTEMSDSDGGPCTLTFTWKD